MWANLRLSGVRLYKGAVQFVGLQVFRLISGRCYYLICPVKHGERAESLPITRHLTSGRYRLLLSDAKLEHAAVLSTSHQKRHSTDSALTSSR